MRSNTKLLVIFTAVLIALGFNLLWIGLEPSRNDLNEIVTSSPSPQIVKTEQSSSSAILGLEGQRAQVTKVVDGDTIEVNINGETFRVRFIGVDTPETVDPRRPVGCFGKEASNETKSLLSSKEVILQKDVSETDKYDRLLRYVYLPLGEGKTLFVNDYLVRAGFAKVSTYPPDVKFTPQFLEAQKQAQQGNKGLWGKC